MKKLLLSFLVFLLLSLPSISFAASSCTIDYQNIPGGKILVFSWTAHTTGAFTAVETTAIIHGYITEVITDPGATAPTDDYDITLTCTTMGGLDLMGTALTNRDTTTTEVAVPYFSAQNIYGWSRVDGKITLNITNNSTNAGNGTVYVFIVEDN